MKPGTVFYKEIAKRAECKVEISVKDGVTDIHWKGDGAGLVFAAFTAIKTLAENTEETFDEIIDVLCEMEECYGLEE